MRLSFASLSAFDILLAKSRLDSGAVAEGSLRELPSLSTCIIVHHWNHFNQTFYKIRQRSEWRRWCAMMNNDVQRCTIRAPACAPFGSPSARFSTKQSFFGASRSIDVYGWPPLSQRRGRPLFELEPLRLSGYLASFLNATRLQSGPLGLTRLELWVLSNRPTAFASTTGPVACRRGIWYNSAVFS